MRATPEAGRDKRLAGFQVVAAMVALMWGLEVIDVIADHRLDRLGIEPRETDGLVGVVTAPFLHGGFGHLISNTLPFATMGLVIAFQGAARVLAVTALVALVSGLGTWLLGQDGTVHIGASGVVFGYATYLLARGFFNRDGIELAIGAVVAVVWGGALLGGLLPEEGISWQSHVFGAIGGVIAAQLLARKPGGSDGGRTSPAPA
ncbi:MAG: rhomboid family intramembrane serine protease [Solirubrobacteraceae bacterium]